MANIDHDRWQMALARVREIEKTSSSLKSRFRSRVFTYTKRSAWASTQGFDILPRDQQHESSTVGSLKARVAAESVLIGKFDVDREVRLRAFYPAKAVSIRYQTGGDRNGIARTVDARKKVAPYAPHLMPTIYEHGTIMNEQGAYLIEETVRGETATRGELESIILPLTQQLSEVHRGVGISHRHLSRIVGGMYRKRWSDFVTSQGISETVDRRVQELIDRNALLEVSLTHGDLVSSNILVDGDRFVLVDWEFAASKPIAFDMSKMIINITNFEKALQDMQAGLGGTIGTKPDHYSFREQIALSIILTLSWHKTHLAKAEIAHRTDALARQTAKRLHMVKRLLDIR